jgi:hypothetical protein
MASAKTINLKPTATIAKKKYDPRSRFRAHEASLAKRQEEDKAGGPKTIEELLRWQKEGKDNDIVFYASKNPDVLEMLKKLAGVWDKLANEGDMKRLEDPDIYTNKGADAFIMNTINQRVSDAKEETGASSDYLTCWDSNCNKPYGELFERSKMFKVNDGKDASDYFCSRRCAISACAISAKYGECDCDKLTRRSAPHGQKCNFWFDKEGRDRRNKNA